MKFNFQVKMQVLKKTGELSAVYFRFFEGKVAKTIEVAKGKAFADYSMSGKLLGVELIEPCSAKVLGMVAPKKVREPITKFIKNAGPREMVLA